MQTSEHSHFANHEIRLPAALRHYEVNIVYSETNDNHPELISLDGWDTRLSRHVSIRRLKILSEQSVKYCLVRGLLLLSRILALSKSMLSRLTLILFGSLRKKLPACLCVIGSLSIAEMSS